MKQTMYVSTILHPNILFQHREPTLECFRYLRVTSSVTIPTKNDHGEEDPDLSPSCCIPICTRDHLIGLVLEEKDEGAMISQRVNKPYPPLDSGTGMVDEHTRATPDAHAPPPSLSAIAMCSLFGCGFVSLAHNARSSPPGINQTAPLCSVRLQ
eukprot:scaffold15695_cov160-Amphora_coffeaeformis.AAC.7